MEKLTDLNLKKNLQETIDNLIQVSLFTKENNIECIVDFDGEWINLEDCSYIKIKRISKTIEL